MLGQRATAARDVRQQAGNTTVPGNHADDSTNWLLWHLILSENSPSHAASPAFQSGKGGDFGGGGAGGEWDGPAADNSYFRAELLGITPDSASGIGLDPTRLRIAPEIARELDIRFDVSPPTSADFNAIGSGFEMDTRKIGLDSLSDLGSELGSSISTGLDSSGWSSSSSGSSWDNSSSGSSWDSSSSSSYDSGGSSFD